MKNEKIMCPSSVCIPGSAIIGVANASGTVDIIRKPIPVTPEFIEAAKESGNAPESRFRFTNQCVQNACKQWNGKGCGVVEMVMDFIEVEENLQQLPKCGIRKSCRWYLQKGAAACSVCTYVITDNKAEVQ